VSRLPQPHDPAREYAPGVKRMQGVRPRVFISYTHHGGRELAEDIETELRLRGVDVWRDVRSANLGMGIRETAETVMAEPRTIACLILFTEKTAERPSVRHEARVAFDEARKRPEFKVIPVTTSSFEDLERVLNESEFPPVWKELGTAVPPEEPARMRAVQGLARGVLGHVVGHCLPVEAGAVTIQLNTRDGVDPAPGICCSSTGGRFSPATGPPIRPRGRLASSRRWRT